MGNSLLPLRYPGGKSKIYEKVIVLIETNAIRYKNRLQLSPLFSIISNKVFSSPRKNMGCLFFVADRKLNHYRA